MSSYLRHFNLLTRVKWEVERTGLICFEAGLRSTLVTTKENKEIGNFTKTKKSVLKIFKDLGH